LSKYGVVSFGEDTDSGDVSENDRPIIDSLFSNIIDERCQQELRQTIPSSWNSSKYLRQSQQHHIILNLSFPCQQYARTDQTPKVPFVFYDVPMPPSKNLAFHLFYL
jgi:hypothetical protein